MPNLASSDPEASREFYVGFLGLRIGMDLGWIATYVSPTSPATQVSVARAEPSQVGGFSITVEVDDVDRAHGEALSRGYRILYPLTDEPWGVRRFAVADPSGISVNVMSHNTTKVTS